jgi:hypothetical protein
VEETSLRREKYRHLLRNLQAEAVGESTLLGQRCRHWPRIPGVIEFANWSGTASSDWDALEDGPQVNGSVLPPLHVIDAGAVGNALAYLVANLGLYAGR